MDENVNVVFAQVESLLKQFEENLDDGNLFRRTDETISTLQDLLPMANQVNQEIISSVSNNLLALKDMFTGNRVNFMSPSEDLQLIERPETTDEVRCGRPCYAISKETMLRLREMGYSWSAVATAFSVSRWTIYRRARQFDIATINRFSNITDEELEEVIREFLANQSRLVGFSLVYGFLESILVHVQQYRVRDVLRRLDPLFNQLRWAAIVHRRTYNVRAPNSLWHIDGHHSLVKFGFVIHGAIDGFSRLITFLKCSTNNRSTTVLELFSDAVQDYGVPSRIRTDHGGENVLIWELMETLRGVNRGSALRGTSTQNQRIERLWRDVFRCVCSTYYYLFQSMSDSGILNSDNILHLILLHYIFKPRINKSLKLFCNAWNHHPLRTERNKSPVRIWQSGMSDYRNRELNTTQAIFNTGEEHIDDLEWYGYDPNVAYHRTYDEPGQVVVDDVLGNFVNLQVYLQEQNVDPLRNSQNLGVDIFVEALNICTNLFNEIAAHE